MVDFFMIATKSTKRGTIEIYPKFIIRKSSDLMIRGGDFYAIWLEEKGLWSTDEQDALQLIDRELDRYFAENSTKFEGNVKVLHMWDSESGMIDSWHKYCQKQMRDSFHMLDEKLIFSNTQCSKQDYASKRLSYPLEQGSIHAWDTLMSVIYSEEEREKIEWAIGAIVSGESKHIQKFMVLYGAAGTGKSTVLNIIQKLFEGYYSVFDAKALGSTSNSFALEAFKANPLVAIQHDGDLSHIEDNTRLNSLVSHEMMTVNEKFRSTYANRFKCFLFMGTNKPVKITDAKSGLIRRLIDVSPSGNKLSSKEYHTAMKQIEFELGAIAYHCREVYLNNPSRYNDYIPITMLGASNDFYNFIMDSFYIFKQEDGTTLKSAWEMYRTYCDEAKVPYPFSQRIFKEELKNYFKDYKERNYLEDGTRVRNYYSGFRFDKFEATSEPCKEESSIIFLEQASVFDVDCAGCSAQYANDKETPIAKWDDVKTTLQELDTSKLHYVKVPENHIVIDFDITDEHGQKSYKRNLQEASKFPPTYAELSKSGQGIHLHYIYDGDVSQLSRIYDEHIEVKVFTGKSSLRRKLTKCNRLPIATISSGLPLKGDKNVIQFEGVKNEKSIRTLIARNLKKEYHPATKPSIDFIYKILEDAHSSGLHYDVTDMRNAVLTFALNSTNQYDYCVKLVDKMHFQSDDISEPARNDQADLVFFDVEVFPNLFLVNWKKEGEENAVVRMINPSPAEIENLLKFRLVGFNCRRYDNHILYARLIGKTNEELYQISNRIISGSRNAFFGEAYNISYTDVYDFSSKKQSLKKFEIELGLHHQELGIPWNQPVDEELWHKVAEYCDNDVLATEAVFHNRKADFTARQILADVAGMTVNDTTNSLTTRIIFGSNRNPQEQFHYRFMGDESQMVDPYADVPFRVDNLPSEENSLGSFTAFDKQHRPIFPGYTFECGKSIYRGENVGEGGYVYAEPGMYSNVALLDIASMHPSSIVAEELFGKEYTKRFNDILQARIAIKHKDFDRAKTMLGGALAKYLTDESTADNLAQALKIAINSVYGLTSATFENPFRDIRNKDNIVAKRGALFMVNLKHEVQKRGFTVAHIKTDSIKIPNATPEIIQFVTDYGKMYGYTFEHEATYDRMCLVNDAVYIARYATVEKCEQLYSKAYVDSKKDICKENKKHPYIWTATGKQFQIPYVFKTLFSKESIAFEDMCETKSVNSALYLDMNESLPDVLNLEKELEQRKKSAKEQGIHLDLSGTSGDTELDKLVQNISKGHDYHFVGKVGEFCPIQAGCGGGLLLRETEDKNTGERGYASATGAKGFRWLESEMVKSLGKEQEVDRAYYRNLVDEAVRTISSYGDFERFVADEPYSTEDMPPWEEEDTTAFDVR